MPRPLKSQCENLPPGNYFGRIIKQSKNSNQIIANTNYNQEIPAIIGKENYIGVQFHPEKSGNSGQKFIYNWLKWIP